MSLLTRLNDTQYRFLHAIRHPGALDVGRRPGTAKDFSALNGGRHALPSQKRDRGSLLSMVIRMTKADVEECGRRVFSLIPPVGITTG